MKIASPKIVKSIREATGERCEACGLIIGKHLLHIHHEPSWGSTGLDTRLTLILIDSFCHSARHTKGEVVQAKIIAAICKRERCDPEERESVIKLLKRAPFKTPKDARREWFDGESENWRESTKVLLRPHSERGWNLMSDETPRIAIATGPVPIVLQPEHLDRPDTATVILEQMYAAWEKEDAEERQTTRGSK